MLIRRRAMEILQRVFHHQQKASQLLDAACRNLAARQRGLLHELVYGVLRRRFSLEADYSRFCRAKPDPHAQIALLLGSYQIRHMRIPDHAALAATVEAIKAIQPAAAGYVNAVLRRVCAEAPPKKLKPFQRAELPQWLYARWRDAFGAERVEQFMRDCQEVPGLSLALFVDRRQWIDEAAAAGFHAVAGDCSPHAVLLPAGTNVTALPGYEDGAFVVMDQAAQAAVMAMQVDEHAATILDLCAAPGGKTALLAHRFPDRQILAVELQAKRMARLEENLRRLHRAGICRNVRVIQGDATALPLPDGSVDAIFLDAPCSASGILRRHPDAKFLHQPADLEPLASRQRKMLMESRRILRENGSLLYAVCSIHELENEGVVECGGWRVVRSERRFPSKTHDGFFHAALRREDRDG